MSFSEAKNKTYIHIDCRLWTTIQYHTKFDKPKDTDLRSPTSNDANPPKRPVELHPSRLNCPCKEGLAPDSRRWTSPPRWRFFCLFFQKPKVPQIPDSQQPENLINPLSHSLPHCITFILTSLKDHNAIIEIPKPCMIHLNLVRVKSLPEPTSLSPT